MKFQTLKYSAPLRNLPKDKILNNQSDIYTENSYPKIKDNEKRFIEKIYDCCNSLRNHFNYLYEKYIKTKKEFICINNKDLSSEIIKDSYVLMSDN